MDKIKKIIAVTACPTGIAHTYIASEAIEKAAKELGYDVKVEKQGRAISNKLSKNDIDSADIIILAIDRAIDNMERFNGKKIIKVGIKDVIKDAKKVISDFEKGKTEIVKVASSQEISGDLEWKSFLHVYKNLMGGVSRMLPFIVAGGIILGLGFLFDSGVTGGNFGVTRNISRWFSGLGKIGLGVFVPILGGYVAYSIIGPEGFMPGFTAGVIASGGGLLYGGAAKGWSNLWGGLTPGVDQATLAAGSGFIGAIVGGYVAAAMVMILRKYVFAKTNKNFQGIISILAIPVFSVIMTGVIMFCIQIPLVYVAYGLKKGITSLHERNLIWLLGLIIGAMMASDMGGPINKAAYATATSMISQENAGPGEYQVMGAVMIAGMVPPIAIAFSNIVFRQKAWTKSDIQASYSNWLLGAFFITEGAIPYAGKDPKRVIPSIIVGSMVSGLIMGLLKVGVSAPHGGIFVFALLKSHLFDSYGVKIGMGITFALAAIAAGMVAGGLMLGFWRLHDIKKGKLVLNI